MSGLDPVHGARLVERLLRLYPAGWRDRYGEEFAAVLLAALAAGARRWRIAADVTAGAVDAHLHRSHQTGGRPMPDRIRSTASTAFCAFVAFVIAGGAFAKMSEDPPFRTAARAHGAIGLSLQVIYLGAVLAGLAVLAGGLPVLGAILRQALAGRRDLRRLLLVAPAAEGAWLAVTLLLSRGPLSLGGRPGAHAAFLAVVGLGILAQGLSAWALVAATGRADLPPGLTRPQWPAMTVLSLAMVAVSVAGLVWGLALRSQVPGLYHSDNGLVATALPATWAAAVAVMVVASVLAAAATVRAVGLTRAERVTGAGS